MQIPDGKPLIEVFNDWATYCYMQSALKGFWEDCDKISGIVFRAITDPSNNETHQKNLHLLEDGQKLALMHSELSEALEAARKNLQSDKLEGFTGVEEELADLVIRVFDYAGRRKLRLGEAIVKKMLYNATRPHKHGKEF